jgi:hypothetical protein
MMKHNSQSGNALWFILIAIVLLGGLTVLMSRSSSTSDDAGDYERGQIQVSEILRYAKSIEMAITNLQTNNQCSENDLNFDTPDLVGYDNLSAPTNENCDVFSAAGGGETYSKPKTSWLDSTHQAEPDFGDYVFSGGTFINGVGNSAGGNPDPKNKELMIFLPYINRETCLEINNKVGVANDNAGEPPLDNTAGIVMDPALKYVGAFVAGNLLDSQGSGSTTEIDGKKTGCVQGEINGAGAGPYYVFFHVLITR